MIYLFYLQIWLIKHTPTYCLQRAGGAFRAVAHVRMRSIIKSRWNWHFQSNSLIIPGSKHTQHSFSLSSNNPPQKSPHANSTVYITFKGRNVKGKVHPKITNMSCIYSLMTVYRTFITLSFLLSSSSSVEKYL